MRMILSGRMLLIGVSGLTLSGVIHPATAWGQESGAPNVSSIEDIIVTAQKRADNVQDVPASIVAMTGNTLTKLGVSSASDLAKAIPNLNVISVYGEGGSPAFVLRGVTANDFSHNQSRPVALYVDDGIRGVAALEIMQLYDIERTEVLRGPQGTLYGKNATGGAINIITRKPGFDTEGYLTAGYGSFNRAEVRGAVQTALIDGVLATRLAFSYTKDDGLIKNVFPGGQDQDQTDTLGLRLGLTFKPSDTFEAVLRVFHARSTGVAAGSLAANIGPSLGVNRVGLGFFENSSNFDGRRNIRDTGANLTINIDLSPTYRLTSISTYDRAKWIDSSDPDGLPISNDELTIGSDNIDQFVQELRLTSSYDGSFNWIGGLFFGYDKMDIINFFRFYNEPSLGLDFGLGGFGFNEANSFTQKRTSYAGYLRGEYELTDALKVSAGIRYSKDKVDVTKYSAALGATVAGGTPQFNIPTFTNQESHPKWNNVSVEAGLDWKVTDDVLAYASFKQGYRTGAVNATAFESPLEITSAKPEKVNSYEIGLKSDFFDRRLIFNLAAFRYDYSDQQFSNNENGLFVLRNADKSRIWGIELDSTVRVLDEVTFNVGLGWLDPKYKKLDLTPLDPLTGDFSGNQMIGASKWSLNLGTDWQVMRANDGIVTLHLDALYRSKIYYDAANLDRIAGKNYWVANGRLSYDSKRFGAALWIKNAFNKKYIVSGFDGISFALDQDSLKRGARQTYGAEVTFKF